MTRLVKSGWPWRMRPDSSLICSLGWMAPRRAELRAAADSVRGPAVDCADMRSSVGSAALPAGTDLALDLVARAELVLADELARRRGCRRGRGGIPSLGAGETRCPCRQLENAEASRGGGHGALDPIENGGESLGPGHAERLAEAELVEEVVRHAGHLVRRRAVEALRAKREMKPRTVGDSGGTSAWMWTLPPSTSTQRKTGVWHSGTRWSSLSAPSRPGGARGAAEACASSRAASRAGWCDPRP